MSRGPITVGLIPMLPAFKDSDPMIDPMIGEHNE